MDWLDEELGGFEDDYLIIDCPGWWIALASRVLYSPTCRSNRVVHSPSVSAYPRPTSIQNGYTSLCCVSDRVTIHGGPIQIF